MKLDFVDANDVGVISKERLVFNASADGDVGHCAIFCAYRRDDVVLARVKSVFWFPDKAVKSGDLIVVYSKAGGSSERQLDKGRTAYFFYWGSDKPIWSDKEVVPVVLQLTGWKSYFLDPAKQIPLKLGSSGS